MRKRVRKLRKELGIENLQSDLKGRGETKSCQTRGLAILELCEMIQLGISSFFLYRGLWYHLPGRPYS